MPYKNKDDSKLPEFVKKLSDSTRTKWVSIFNRVYSEEGEKMAMIVANSWLKKQKKKELVAKSSQVRKLTFELDTSGKFIKKDANGDSYVSFMLTDTLRDKHGDTYTPELLQQWADDINNGNMIIGDINHEEYDKIVMSNVDENVINQKLKEKKGIARAVKAIFEKGKLWIKAIIDKRYEKIIEKANGVSLEAFIEDSKDSIAQAGKILGFSFMVGQEQANPRAVIS